MYIEFAHLKVVVGAVSLTLRTFYCLKKDKVTASEGPWLCTKKKVNQAEPLLEHFHTISKGLKKNLDAATRATRRLLNASQTTVT